MSCFSCILCYVAHHTSLTERLVRLEQAPARHIWRHKYDLSKNLPSQNFQRHHGCRCPQITLISYVYLITVLSPLSPHYPPSPLPGWNGIAVPSCKIIWNLWGKGAHSPTTSFWNDMFVSEICVYHLLCWAFRRSRNIPHIPCPTWISHIAASMTTAW